MNRIICITICLLLPTGLWAQEDQSKKDESKKTIEIDSALIGGAIKFSQYRTGSDVGSHRRPGD